MAATPQTRGAPSKRGGPSPLLILLLLLLLPGSQAQTPARPLTSETPETPWAALSVVSGPACAPPGQLHVWPGPPSSSAAPGQALSLECRYQAPPGARVTWLQVCPRHGASPGCTWPQEVPAEGEGLRVEGDEPGVSRLSFQRLQRNHSGLYFCRVHSGAAAAQSCGTYVRVEGLYFCRVRLSVAAAQSCGIYVRVKEPLPVPFLRLGEAAKNRILVGQGVLLLLCSAGPGLLLLFRKRWANERLLQPKKISLEEENLYEGLNLDECSMYEDISRGAQPTYQDVGTPPAAEGLLEKP